MILYLNQFGIVSGVAKLLKVALWVAASGAIAALVAKLNEYQIQPGQVYAVAGTAAVNALLAGAGKYLSTNQPDFSIPFMKRREDASPLQ